MPASVDVIRRVEPLAGDWRQSRWPMGQFDTAERTFTREVEGVIRTPDHIVMVTLSGGAEHLEVKTDCGHRYSGPEQAGSVSFVPAGCTRHLALRGVASRWGSIALDPKLFVSDGREGLLAPHAFSNRADPLIAALVAALSDRLERNGSIDPLYGEALGLALIRHLTRTHGVSISRSETKDWRLPRWKLSRIAEYVRAHLAEPMQIADLAAVAGLSAGHFHRAFKASTGMTPLVYIQRCRIDRAVDLMHNPDLGLAAIALQVGFQEPSHFARTFRHLKGCNPAVFRRRREAMQ